MKASYQTYQNELETKSTRKFINLFVRPNSFFRYREMKTNITENDISIAW